MVNMTKEELISEIYRMDQSYLDLKIDLNKYSVKELQICYDRKKNAPIKRPFISRFNYNKREVPQVKTEAVKEEPKSVALSGFDALNKNKGKI